MAHECPECGQTCYCHGDIDDCLFDSEYHYIHCDHCPIDGAEPDDEDYEFEEAQIKEGN